MYLGMITEIFASADPRGGLLLGAARVRGGVRDGALEAAEHQCACAEGHGCGRAEPLFHALRWIARRSSAQHRPICRKRLLRPA